MPSLYILITNIEQFVSRDTKVSQNIFYFNLFKTKKCKIFLDETSFHKSTKFCSKSRSNLRQSARRIITKMNASVEKGEDPCEENKL